MQEHIIGKYKILEEIGRGGMGVVYKGRHNALNMLAAIKTLPAQLASDESFLQRFMDEADTLARLQHQNIVNIYDIEVQNNTYYLIMEYVSGQTLADLLKAHGPFPPDEAARIVCDVAAALSHTHVKGVIHRDIKPANIMIDENDVVKVTDFGIARVSEGSGLTRTGVIGTPKYLSPERIKAEKDIDGRSDLYSLGIVFYEMLTGRVPFSDSSDYVICEKQVGEEPLPPSSLIPDLPEIYEKIILKCLEKDKDDRYSGCEELVDSLKDIFLERKSGSSRVYGNNDKEKMKRKGRYLLLSVLILLIASVLIYVMYPDDGKSPERDSAGVIQFVSEKESPLILRTHSLKNNDLLRSIKKKNSVFSETEIKRCLLLKTGIKNNGREDSAFLSDLRLTLDRLHLISWVDAGYCDVLLTISGVGLDKKLTVECNMYGDEIMIAYREELPAENKDVLFSELSTIIKRNFCFNALRFLNLLNPPNDEINLNLIDVKKFGKVDRLFQIDDIINICMTSPKQRYCMLFDVNFGDITLLFPCENKKNNFLAQGETQCSGNIEIFPPTGNEMVFAVMCAKEQQLPLTNYHFSPSQPYFTWSYDLSDPENAVSFCEKLVYKLTKEPFDQWSAKNMFFKTIRHSETNNRSK